MAGGAAGFFAALFEEIGQFDIMNFDIENMSITNVRGAENEVLFIFSMHEGSRHDCNCQRTYRDF
ncbi:hypothetical protein J41TS4_17120 [Paenibacillus apis]|uniref:Uncharacterized protein n=1 Tax=Paenibacillus apis TaxID=1792174 RepID=A0A919Y1F7_9BACL|nr:hypothetical protein J41TS4_17120 [Paenibacillus apis]